MDYDPESDLRTLEAMASNLTPYLYEQELYGTLSKNLPKLTVGGLLLRLYRLHGLEDQLSSAQQQRLRDAIINYEQQRSDWMVHYEGKIEQELAARLRSLHVFLDDYAEDSTLARANYPVEATRRTIIHHLQAEAQELELWTDEFEEQLARLDRRLRTALGGATGAFSWSQRLQPLYPAGVFWWLYGEPLE